MIFVLTSLRFTFPKFVKQCWVQDTITVQTPEWDHSGHKPGSQDNARIDTILSVWRRYRLISLLDLDHHCQFCLLVFVRRFHHELKDSSVSSDSFIHFNMVSCLTLFLPPLRKLKDLQREYGSRAGLILQLFCHSSKTLWTGASRLLCQTYCYSQWFRISSETILKKTTWKCSTCIKWNQLNCIWYDKAW